VISKTITETEILQITEVLKRKPLIWDNLHANDYDVGSRQFSKLDLKYYYFFDSSHEECFWALIKAVIQV
jgi:hypothetical protein